MFSGHFNLKGDSEESFKQNQQFSTKHDGIYPATQYTVHSTQYTVHSTQYTVHSTQYTVHSTQYTVHSTQYTVHSTQYTVHSTQYTVHSTQYTVHSTQYTVHSTQYTVHSTQYTVHSTQYTVHSTQYTVHSTQYTVHSTQYTVHSTQYTVHSTQYTVHSTQYTVHSTQYTVHSTQYTVHSTQTVVGLLHLLCDRNFPWTLHVPKKRNTGQDFPCTKILYVCENDSRMREWCENGVRECENDSRMRLASSVCLGGVTRGGQCTFSGFLNSTRSAVSDPTSHYPRPPRKRPGGPKIPKIVTGSDQKIKIPKKKGVLGQGLYLAYSYFLAHKRDMAMATAHDSYFRK